MAVTGMGGARRLRSWAPLGSADIEQLALESAKLAVELGADIHATDLEGRTALDGARTARWRAVAAFLESRGARPGGN